MALNNTSNVSFHAYRMTAPDKCYIDMNVFIVKQWAVIYCIEITICQEKTPVRLVK